jgi:hypothetical protein
MKLEFFEAQIGAIAAAAKGSRWVLIVALVVSIAQIGATFNFGFSWGRTFAEGLAFTNARHAVKQPDKDFDKDGFDKNPVVRELQKELVKNWVDQQFVNVPLVGLKFAVADENMVGGIALIVISIWLFYCLRRENLMIGTLMRVAKDETPAIRAHVYTGLPEVRYSGRSA